MSEDERGNRPKETRNRDVAQLVSALRSGRRGRAFESPHPDQKKSQGRKTLTFFLLGLLINPDIFQQTLTIGNDDLQFTCCYRSKFANLFSLDR